MALANAKHADKPVKRGCDLGQSMRLICALVLFWIALSSSAGAGTIEGRVSSIDSEGRTVTLDGGEVLKLLETFPVEELAIGQLVRFDYIDGTLDSGSMLVLEPPPEIIPDEEPIIEDPQPE